MAAGAKHYFRDGRTHKGKFHRMPNGDLHSGTGHSASSKRLFHYGQLSKKAQVKARTGWKK